MNKPSIKTRELTLPAFWASYLINADRSSFDDSAVILIHQCLHSHGLKIGSCLSVEDGDEYYVNYHDAIDYCQYSTNCLEFTFAIN